MNLEELTKRFSGTTEDRQKAIFSTLFIAANRLQTLFDSRIPGLSLKQFMLLSLVRQSEKPLAFTELGGLLGCSRQNVKKLAKALEEKGFASICQSPADPRALCLYPTEKAGRWFREDFAAYREELRYLFEVYTEEETEALFRLLTRLYAGMDNLGKKAAGKEEPK